MNFTSFLGKISRTNIGTIVRRKLISKGNVVFPMYHVSLNGKVKCIYQIDSFFNDVRPSLN